MHVRVCMHVCINVFLDSPAPEQPHTVMIVTVFKQLKTIQKETDQLNIILDTVIHLFTHRDNCFILFRVMVAPELKPEHWNYIFCMLDCFQACSDLRSDTQRLLTFGERLGIFFFFVWWFFEDHFYLINPLTHINMKKCSSSYYMLADKTLYQIYF